MATEQSPLDAAAEVLDTAADYDESPGASLEALIAARLLVERARGHLARARAETALSRIVARACDEVGRSLDDRVAAAIVALRGEGE